MAEVMLILSISARSRSRKRFSFLVRAIFHLPLCSAPPGAFFRGNYSSSFQSNDGLLFVRRVGGIYLFIRALAECVYRYTYIPTPTCAHFQYISAARSSSSDFQILSFYPDAAARRKCLPILVALLSPLSHSLAHSCVHPDA